MNVPLNGPAIVAPTRHTLDVELATSVSIFKWLPEGRWLRGLLLPLDLILLPFDLIPLPFDLAPFPSPLTFDS